MKLLNLSKYSEVLDRTYVKKLGRVSRVVGLTIESVGPEVNVSDLCLIKATKHSEPVYAEVVGFKDNNILLMPIGSMQGIGPGSIVEACNTDIKIDVSDDMLGRVLDGLGNPIDNLGSITSGTKRSITQSAPDPLSRNRITEPLQLGVRTIDGLLTLGKGQRVGIFAGSGVGKSTLMGMIARNTKAEVNVISLVGERGREVKEFLEKDLGEEGLARSVVVIATSDKPALVRLKCAEVATTIAEYFRDRGKDVVLLMDSLTRYAMAQREVGLAAGEPPVTRGYTPSVFSMIPKLLERAGCSDKGSITGIYTVLVDGDDLTEPVTDTARGVLDGHIVLSRKIAARNQYPSIDVLASVSRLMNDIASPEHKKAANEIKKNMAVYSDAEDLINIGAYVSGSNEDIDKSIAMNKDIRNFLQQGIEEKIMFDETLDEMKRITQ
ncbi:MAG: flagellar protein export ATPase FliI [Defluviitaleaceae bacterium]|nr:flagellar protein export ATPase FliI [Defluviitaleaceae bacterium]